MILAAAFVVGPILGGVLTLIDWRLNFYFNIPIGLVTLYLGARYLREPDLPRLSTARSTMRAWPSSSAGRQAFRIP
jgi:MFS family permease